MGISNHQRIDDAINEAQIGAGKIKAIAKALNIALCDSSDTETDTSPGLLNFRTGDGISLAWLIVELSDTLLNHLNMLEAEHLRSGREASTNSTSTSTAHRGEPPHIKAAILIQHEALNKAGQLASVLATLNSPAPREMAKEDIESMFDIAEEMAEFLQGTATKTLDLLE